MKRLFYVLLIVASPSFVGLPALANLMSENLLNQCTKDGKLSVLPILKDNLVTRANIENITFHQGFRTRMSLEKLITEPENPRSKTLWIIIHFKDGSQAGIQTTFKNSRHVQTWLQTNTETVEIAGNKVRRLPGQAKTYSTIAKFIGKTERSSNNCELYSSNAYEFVLRSQGFATETPTRKTASVSGSIRYGAGPSTDCSSKEGKMQSSDCTLTARSTSRAPTRAIPYQENKDDLPPRRLALDKEYSSRYPVTRIQIEDRSCDVKKGCSEVPRRERVFRF